MVSAYRAYRKRNASVLPREACTTALATSGSRSAASSWRPARNRFHGTPDVRSASSACQRICRWASMCLLPSALSGAHLDAARRAPVFRTTPRGPSGSRVPRVLAEVPFPCPTLATTTLRDDAPAFLARLPWALKLSTLGLSDVDTEPAPLLPPPRQVTGRRPMSRDGGDSPGH